MSSFTDVAIKLARNPLGIIALFIVLIYSIACLTFYKASNLPSELVSYFVIFILFYPIIVLIAFYRLVTKHHAKLYAPEDFVNPEHFIDCFYGDQRRVLTKNQTLTQTKPTEPVKSKTGEIK